MVLSGVNCNQQGKKGFIQCTGSERGGHCVRPRDTEEEEEEEE